MSRTRAPWLPRPARGSGRQREMHAVQASTRGSFRNGVPFLRTGSGAPLVFLPGISDGHRPTTPLDRWRQSGQVALLARNREVWWMGRGPGLPAGSDLAQLAREYADTMRTRFDQRVDVVGVSTGGSIALQLAADHPDVVSRLVMVSSAYRLGEDGRRTQRLCADHLRAGRPDKAAAELMFRLGRNPPERVALSLAGRVFSHIVVGDDDRDLLALLDAEDGFDLSGRLSEVTAPTLVLGGDSDGFYPEQLFRDTVRGIHDAQLVRYPGVGHMTTHGNHRLAADVESFLRGGSPGLPRAL